MIIFLKVTNLQEAKFSIFLLIFVWVLQQQWCAACHTAIPLVHCPLMGVLLRLVQHMQTHSLLLKFCDPSSLDQMYHPALAELVECADDKLFDKVLINSEHVLYGILPRETVSTYAFRRRRQNRELISKTTHLAQCSFIVRMLYKDMY